MTKKEKLEIYCSNLNYNGFSLDHKQISIITYLINYYLEKITDYDIDLTKIYNGGTKTNFISIPDDNGIKNDFSITIQNGILFISNDELNVKIISKENEIMSSAKYEQGENEYIQINEASDSILPNIYINRTNNIIENKLNARYESRSMAYKTGKELISQIYEDKSNNIYTTRNFSSNVDYYENKNDLYDYLNSVFENYNYIINNQDEFIKGKSKKKTK